MSKLDTLTERICNRADEALKTEIREALFGLRRFTDCALTSFIEIRTSHGREKIYFGDLFQDIELHAIAACAERYRKAALDKFEARVGELESELETFRQEFGGEGGE